MRPLGAGPESITTVPAFGAEHEYRGYGFRVRAKSAPRNDGYFFTTRNVALARAITAPSAFTKHCAKQSVLPVLITSVSTVSHCPICALEMKSIAMLTVASEPAPPN